MYSLRLQRYHSDEGADFFCVCPKFESQVIQSMFSNQAYLKFNIKTMFPLSLFLYRCLFCPSLLCTFSNLACQFSDATQEEWRLLTVLQLIIGKSRRAKEDFC